MIQLRVLGGTDLRSSDGQELRAVLAQPKRLALLVYLALATPRGPQRRDRLVALFWPEQDTDRARNALSQAIFFLRRVLGADAILNRNGEEIELARDQIWCDATAFEDAVRKSQSADAVELYRGELLSGVHVPEAAAELEQWLESTRKRFAEAFAEAVEAVASEREEAGDFRGAVYWWRRLATLDPYSARIAIRLMVALAASGDRSAAIQHARVYEALVANELESQPDPGVAALAQELQSGAPIALHPGPTHIDFKGAHSASHRDGPEPDAVTPRSVPPLPPRAQAPRSRWRLRRPTTIAIAAIAIVALAAIFIVRLRSASAAPVINSIAVLPFDGYSSDPRQDYLAESLTDAIITELATMLPKHTVIARQSVLQFAGSKMAIPEIARALGVDAIVEGTFLRDGQHIRLNAQLIYGDRHLWAKHYDRDIADLVSLEDELAAEIAHEIHAVASGDSLGVKRPIRPPDPIVQGQYVHGQYLLLSRTPASLRQAIELFQAAIALDSTFALGYAAIAEAFGLASDEGFLDQVMANDSVTVYVKRALAIDSLLGTAHAVHAGSLSEAGNFAEAEQEFKRAIELDRGNALAHHWYAMLLATLKRGPEAVAENTRAEEIDPQSVPIRNVGDRIRGYFHAPRRPTGRERPPLVQLDPTNAWSTSNRAVTYARQHKCDEAKRQSAKAVEDVPDNIRMTLLAARVHLLCGDRPRALALFNEAKHLPQAHRHGLYIALAFHTLNQTDSMFAWLDSTSWNVEQRFNFRTDLGLDSLRDDPRYKRVLQRMGFGQQ